MDNILLVKVEKCRQTSNPKKSDTG